MQNLSEDVDIQNTVTAQIPEEFKDIPDRELTDEELAKLADLIMEFSQEMTGVKLYEYQYEFGWRIIYSLLVEDAEEITALYARQSGKTEAVAVVVCGIMVLFPIFAEALPHDSRINKFKDGVWCGIYGPNYEQAGIMWSRMKIRMYSKKAKAVLLDSEIDIDLTDANENMTLPNGSFCDCGTASPQASIEGKTFHLLLLEECVKEDTLIECEDGPREIYEVVRNNYKGKVLALDHNTGEVVWAKVEEVLERPAFDECYELVFEDETVVGCTGNHPWFIDGVGYLNTKDIFAQCLREGSYCKNEGFHTLLFVKRMPTNETKTNKLISIKKIPPIKKVYDIKTSVGNFFANGILSHNCQDISNAKIRESIHPMGASTAATIVKIGTCNRNKSDFYEACRRNKRSDTNTGLLRSKYRTHFEYDYTHAQRYNPRYRKYIIKEKHRLGEDSDEFKMKYRLVWMTDRGMFVNPDLFDECGIKKNNDVIFVYKGKGSRRKKILFSRSPNAVTFDPTTSDIVAAIDVGRDNSTVVTVGKVFWDGQVKHGNEIRYPIHIYNWLELAGDDHESQHPQIVNFLKNYRVSHVVIDATGKGDPVYSRLAAELDKFGILVTPFVFSTSSKDVGYKVFEQELKTRRFTFPAGSRVTRLTKWRRFVNQMYDLEKEWRGQTLVVHKAKDDSSARDDFPDSAMMLCWAVNVRGTMEVESSMNPLLGRAAAWIEHDMKNIKAWYRARTDPRKMYKQTRQGRRGKWD